MALGTSKQHQELIAAAADLRDKMSELSFSAPVTHVYNPLDYAWDAHVAYLKRSRPRRVSSLFLGMNPGPWGMAQTGVPFGEIEAVRCWLGIETDIGKPDHEHPKRPIEGFSCKRSEVSGRRLWGLFQERFADADEFFSEHFIANFCPLVFMEETGKNRTPDKLSKSERTTLDQHCTEHLSRVIQILKPKYLIGIGAYAEKQLTLAAKNISTAFTITRILHPSPASPAANRDWRGTATKQLTEAGIW